MEALLLLTHLLVMLACSSHLLTLCRRLLAGADTTRQLVNEPFVRAVQLQQGPASVVAKGWKPPRVKSCSMQVGAVQFWLHA
jgi:hypothetical protein